MNTLLILFQKLLIVWTRLILKKQEKLWKSNFMVVPHRWKKPFKYYINNLLNFQTTYDIWLWFLTVNQTQVALLKSLSFWKRQTLGSLLKGYKKVSILTLDQVEPKYQVVKNKGLQLQELLQRILKYWYWTRLLQLWTEKMSDKFKKH